MMNTYSIVAVVRSIVIRDVVTEFHIRFITIDKKQKDLKLNESI